MTKSKTTTFYKWLKETAIEIPMLQRDYAQGRDDSKTKELRKNFVSDLLKAIKRETEDEKRHLDFIYGPESDGTFQPLDGQQRLTTLFLIHWYLAAKAGRLPEAKEVLEKFRYKVRVSTQEFITALLIPDNAPCKELSKKNLTDAKWYFSSWDYDPSIQGMLNMIDTIYENLQNKDQAECSNLWNLLVCENAKDAPITFTVLNMEKFGLGDELYMRMNARGLALSDFENFKAWLHGQCERKALNDDRYFSEPKDNFTPSEKHWGYKLDREWTAFFWEKSGYDPKSMNDTFLRFFQLTALNSFAGEHKGNIDPSKKNKEEYKKAELFKTNISRLAGEEEHIPNKDYEKTYNLLDGDTLNDLFALFDFIAVKGDSWLKETLEPVPFFFEDQSTPVDILYKKKLTYPQRVLFHALQKFVTKNGFQKESKEHRDALIAWMRVTRNLVVNSNIDAPAPFVRAIKSTNSLLPKSFAKKSWLEYLSDETTQIEGFSTDQIAEERLKAKLMLGSNGENWEQVIIDAENHPLFRGQIGFLFQKTELSGSETKVAKLELATIQRRLENAEQFFSEIGVTEPFVHFRSGFHSNARIYQSND